MRAARGPVAGGSLGFYGWTGGLALAVQLLLTTRIMSRGGMARSIALHPVVLLVLSAGMLAAPGLVLATGLRGADSTLKKSVFRSVVEFLWVPVPAPVRRRSKTFVDTMGENAGDGVGALVVLFIVTLGGLSSLWLSGVVIALSLVLIGLARRMGREYFATLRGRLAEGDSNETLARQRIGSAAGPHTLSRIDVTRLLAVVDAGRPRTFPASSAVGPVRRAATSSMSSLGEDDLRSRLESVEAFGREDVDQFARALARDGARDLAASRLIEIGEPAGPALAAIVADESADFVVRRRVAQVLAAIPGDAACAGLLAALAAGRFEVRYRAARALARRQHRGEECSPPIREAAWKAIRAELSRGRAVWELAHLLDANEYDDLGGGQAVERGEPSLEHVFRLLGLVLDSAAIRSAWGGIIGNHTELESLALEYLEHVLPEDIRRNLWPFIGDLSDEESRRTIRPLDAVIGDLLETGETLFAGNERVKLQRFLEPREKAAREPTSDPTSDPPDSAGSSD